MSGTHLPATIQFDSNPSDEALEVLEDQLNHFNVQQTGIQDFQRLAFVLWDSDRTAIAGIAGWTWGGACEIRTLWVQEAWRGRQLGQYLLQLAEEEATERGCSVMVLDTHSFQAPTFYQHQGYTVVGIVDGYPHGHQKYYFQKRLYKTSPLSDADL